MNTAVSIQDLYKTYKGGTQALKGISFEIREGEFFALLGPNGSGKSSTINIMSGATKKTEGQVKIFGKDIDTHREETKMMIGVVPQEISFDSFFTVNEVLLLQSGYYGVRNNQKWINEILNELGLYEKRDERTRSLSGGMKRRLLIAKALVHKPRLLVLDEPTAGVDIELRFSMWKFIRALNKDGITILLTTHYLEEAESLCERVAIINLGELVALDKTQKLLHSMGNKKTLTLTFLDEIGPIPKELQTFNPEKLTDHALTLTFEGDQTAQVFKKVDDLGKKVTDIDIKGQKLEDVFLKLTTNNK